MDTDNTRQDQTHVVGLEDRTRQTGQCKTSQDQRQIQRERERERERHLAGQAGRTHAPHNNTHTTQTQQHITQRSFGSGRDGGTAVAESSFSCKPFPLSSELSSGNPKPRGDGPEPSFGKPIPPDTNLFELASSDNPIPRAV